MHFCQQLGLSARLLYAGDALIAAAFIVVLILSAVTIPANPSKWREFKSYI